MDMQEALLRTEFENIAAEVYRLRTRCISRGYPAPKQIIEAYDRIVEAAVELFPDMNSELTR